MASRQSDLTLGRRTGNRPGKDRIMSKMITGGGAYDLRRRNKHCQSVHKRPGNLGGQAPKPPSDRRNDAVATMWITMKGEAR